MVITSSPFWLRAVQRSLTRPRSGLDLEGRFSITSVKTLKVSPGRTG